MRGRQASTTAQGIAFVRAPESSKPEGERICTDLLARRLINPWFYWLSRLLAGYAERKVPGVKGFLVARCRHIDDYLQTWLEMGLDQLVILGAGLDSRACRFEQLAEHVDVFEVDHRATKQIELGKLEKILGKRPGHVPFFRLTSTRKHCTSCLISVTARK
jgi:methyltransferase (TIGR00027 family)